MTDTEDQSGTATPVGEDLSFEQARDLLGEVVDRLQQGPGTLEESLALWERGEQLAKICQDYLNAARVRIERVIAANDTSDSGQVE